ncbi:hypothetical protein SNE40_005196 [Patella caerulea]|uniref:Uncharacterized protein n=1 Tax=Patella caerulea TaxID=87958 RepID=A0AAN8K7B0_PATCE
MAASGINEHMEARRKQKFLDMQANKKKQFIDAYNSNPDNILLEQREQVQQMSYNMEGDGIRKVGSPPGITDKDIQKYRTGKTKLVVYSAKLPDRLSSINYSQQW